MSNNPYICSVRFISFILALVMLTLSVQPACVPVAGNDTCCARTDDCCSDEQGDCDDEKDCTKGCNPFQVCGCCAFSAVIPKPIILIQSLPAATVVHWGIHPTAEADAPVSGFWQPPRQTA